MKQRLIFTLCITTFFISSCIKDEDYSINDKLAPDSIINIASIEPNGAFADSSTEIIVRVTINKQSSANQPITLTTTQGLINNSSKSETVTTNTDRYVDFKLKTGQIAGPVFLKATVLTDYSRDTIINFLKAYPDSIIINPEKFIIDKNTTLALEVNLFRYNGYPSLGQNVFYSAVSNNGAIVGRVTTSTGFSPGNVIDATFTPNTDYIGEVFVVVSVFKTDGTKMESRVKITVQ